MKHDVYYQHPNNEVELPGLGWPSIDTRGGPVGSFGWRDRDTAVYCHKVEVGVVAACFAVRAREAEPGPVDACQPAQALFSAEDAVPQQEVRVAETPGAQPKDQDGYQRGQDTGVDFNPDHAGRIEVGARWVAHGGSGVAEEEEKHATPGHNVEDIDGGQEAERGADGAPPAVQAHGRRYAGEAILLRRMVIAVDAWSPRFSLRRRDRI